MSTNLSAEQLRERVRRLEHDLTIRSNQVGALDSQNAVLREIVQEIVGKNGEVVGTAPAGSA